MTRTEAAIIREAFKSAADRFQRESDEAALAHDYPRAIERLSMKAGVEAARFELHVSFMKEGVVTE